MHIPRIVISAPRSGSGKTLITIALIKALTMAGKKISAFKCGPDYIDPLFHRTVLEVPSRNLDLFFTDDDTTRSIFSGSCTTNGSEMAVIEGVMGFYDGLSGISQEASTSHLARVLRAPVVLVIDTKGMARSVLAEIAGFVAMDDDHTIKSVILNNTSQMMYDSLKPEIEKRFGLTVAGYFPHQKDLQIESRYLGLTLPDEIQNLEEMMEKAAVALMKTVSIDALTALAAEADDLEYDSSKAPWLCTKTSSPDAPVTAADASRPRVRIAVARDEAFCFYYQDNLQLLEYYGAELVPFSPVHDKALPHNVKGLLLGGGYPELCGAQLEDNAAMRHDIRQCMERGMPVLAECGGFMYLHSFLTEQNERPYQMVGALDGSCCNTGKLVRFGYVTITEKEPAQQINGCSDKRLLGAGQIKGHEFHYYDSTTNGSDCIARKPVSGKNWECIHATDHRWIGFPHLYYPSSPQFAERFVAACQAFQDDQYQGERR